MRYGLHPINQCNKIMKDSLFSQNSFIVDRNWQKINPSNNLHVPLAQAIEFITALYTEHDQLKFPAAQPRPNMLQLRNQIHNFVLKYIQQKELSSIKHIRNKELPFVREAQYSFDLRDCLEVWRWLSEDLASQTSHVKEANEEGIILNEFQSGKGAESGVQQLEANQNGKKRFAELSVQEQQQVMKKSLEMLFMYKHQLKIIFTHYCRFAIENEHKRTVTFDEVAPSLQTLNLTRFMYFCRDFDLLKLVEFKRKTEHNHKISKQTLTALFKKTAHLQRLLNFDGFIICLINIATKIHQNFDPRSFIQVELLLTNLQVKYHHDFVKKLDSLSIKYSPTDFYNCYKDIIIKSKLKKQRAQQLQLLSLHNDYQQSTEFANLKDLRSHSQNIQSSPIGSVSVSTKFDTKLASQRRHPKQLGKRKSLPVLPSISDNKFFKPIEHQNHLNSYSRYLKQADQSSSVFKNRITGYSNINDLQKSKKPFHRSQNPQYISKESLKEIITDARSKLRANQAPNYLIKPTAQSSSLFHTKSLAEKDHARNESFIRNAQKQLLDQLADKEMSKTVSASVVYGKEQAGQSIGQQIIASKLL